MRKISYVRHRIPLNVIQHAVWLYLRFTLSYRDVDELAPISTGQPGIALEAWGYRPRRPATGAVQRPL